MDDTHRASSLHKRVQQTTRTVRPTQHLEERPSSKPPVVHQPSPSDAANTSTYDEHDQKVVFYARLIAIGVVVIGLVAIMGLAIAVSEAASTKMGSTKSGASSTLDTSETTLPTGTGGANPATGSAGVGAEGAYCSNAYNAALSC
jgi:hypothetical protein